MYYINYKNDNYTPAIGYGIETIDEAETRREALYLLKEYRLSGDNFYISKRATKDWYER